MKRICILISIIIVTATNAFAFFEAVCPSGQTLYYSIIDNINHTVELTCPNAGYSPYPKPIGNVTIPSNVSHDGINYTVVRIGNEAFSGCEGITGVTFPNTMKSIGEKAFKNCSISSISFPISIEIIKNEAFENNPIVSIAINNPEIILEQLVFFNTTWYNNKPNGLIYIGSILYEYKGSPQNNSTITINPGTTSIAAWALWKTNSFFVNIPNSVKVIGQYAFNGNHQIITMPSDLKWIGSYAFENCGGFSTLTLPVSLKYIGGSAFKNCDELTTVHYNAQSASGGGAFTGCDNIVTVSIGSTVRKIPGSLFSGCLSINNLTIGNGVDTISERAFMGCSSLTNITIPESVDFIGQYAFSNCTNLHTIVFNATNCNTDSSGYPPFQNCSAVSTINIGNNVQKIPLRLFEQTGVSSITIPENITMIGSYAFASCTNLNTINFNATNCDTYASSGEPYPFHNCNAISTINIGNNVKKIPNGIFYQTRITDITIPESVTLIESNAFANSTLLTTLRFNAVNCQSNCLYDGPFKGCSALSNITIGNNVHSIPGRLFSDALTASIGTLVLPNLLTYIGPYAFEHCTGITNISIPNSVTVIETEAFSFCSGLTQVTIGTAVDTIGANAFSACNHINVINWNAINCRSTDGRVFTGDCIGSFNIGPSVITIPDNLIGNCYNLTLSHVIFPNTLQRIGAWNFNGCGSGIVHLPSSLTNIGYGAFNGCWGITRIECDAITPPYIESQYGSILFFSSSVPLYVPCESINAYQSAPGWSNFTNITCIDDAIDDVSLDNIWVYTLFNDIIVKGAEGQSLSVYDINGHDFAAINKASDQTAIPVPTAGVYIVRIGTNTIKKVVVQ